MATKAATPNATPTMEKAQLHQTPIRQHTPGPWSLSPSFDRVERRVQHGDNPPLVWGIASGINSAHPDYLPRAEQIANARLIAAAPDLLNLLTAAGRLEELTGENLAAYARTYAALARAAVAKATGGKLKR